MRTTFIGGGNMASALVGGLLKQGWPVSDLSVVEILPQAREALSRRFGVVAHPALPDRLEAHEVIVLAIKPQHMLEAARRAAQPARESARREHRGGDPYA